MTNQSNSSTDEKIASYAGIAFVIGIGALVAVGALSTFKQEEKVSPLVEQEVVNSNQVAVSREIEQKSLVPEQEVVIPKELDERFDQAVAMLHAKEYDYAVKALQRVLEIAPKMPEAYVNLGYALIGLEDYEGAAKIFNAATELEPYQGNAYWGLAISLEKIGDVSGALGAMRTYIHLAPEDQEAFVRKARSAMWEWEETLKRGPLREEEQEWLDRRTREHEERNGPEADQPAAPDLNIQVRVDH